MKKLFSTCLMAMAASTMMAAESPFTVYPDPSVPLTSTLQEIVVSMPEGSGEAFTSVNDNDSIYVTLDGENYRTTSSNTQDGELFIFVKGGGMDVPGSYDLVIGAGAVSINDVPTTQDYVISYTYGSGDVSSNPYLNPTYPEANTVVSKLDSFWIENKTSKNLTLKNAEGIYLAIDFEKAYSLDLNVMDFGFEAYTLGEDGYITEVTEPGEYQLVIEPRSLALVNPEDENDVEYINEAIYFTYTVGTPEMDFSNFPFDFYPAPGSKLATLEYIIIEPNQEMGFTGIDILENPAYQVGICNEEEDFFDFTVEQEDNYIRLVLNEPIKDAGKYSVMITPYTFVAFGEDNAYYQEDFITLTYDVVGPVANPYDVPFIIVDPAAAVVESLLWFELDMNQESGYNEFLVNNEDGVYFTKDGDYYCPAIPESWGNVLYFNPTQYISTSGDYALVIEKGAMGWKNENETVNNPEQYVFNFKVESSASESPAGLPFVLDPEDGAVVKELSEIYMTFDNEYYDIYLDPYTIYLMDENWDNVPFKVEQSAESANTYIITITDEAGNPASVTTAGTYMLAFEPEAIMCEGDVDFYINYDMLMFTFTVDPNASGVETINANKAPEGVYNLMGVKVADTTENLPAGIYIVNGKKVVVK